MLDDMLKQNASKIAILLEYENSYSFFSVFLFRALMNAPGLCQHSLGGKTMGIHYSYSKSTANFEV